MFLVFALHLLFLQGAYICIFICRFSFQNRLPKKEGVGGGGGLALCLQPAAFFDLPCALGRGQTHHQIKGVMADLSGPVVTSLRAQLKKKKVLDRVLQQPHFKEWSEQTK